MQHTQQAIRLSCVLLASAWLFQACSTDRPCNTAYQPGPAIVTIDCTDEARAAALPEDALLVEYTDENGKWNSCLRNDFLEMGHEPYTQPVCDVEHPTTPKFDCGYRSLRTFEIRARQNGRSAGPVEIKTRMENACKYDEKTLYHELHLDLIE